MTEQNQVLIKIYKCNLQFEPQNGIVQEMSIGSEDELTSIAKVLSIDSNNWAFRILPSGCTLTNSEDKYPLCLFATQKNGLVKLSTSTSFASAVITPPRDNMDFVFETGTGRCILGSERIGKILESAIQHRPVKVAQQGTPQSVCHQKEME